MDKEMTVEQIEAKMQENRAKYGRESTAIEADKHLTNEGKLDRLGKLKTETHETHEDLKREHAKAVERTRDTLYRRAFHKGVASIDSYRTIYTMASATPDAKALERLKAQAINTEDTLLKKAVQQVAYDKGYVHLLDLDENPLVEALLEFEYEHALRQTHDPVRKRRQLQMRLHQALRVTAPY